jgi:hypothetical protein
MIIVQLAQLFTSMASCNSLIVIVGEEKLWHMFMLMHSETFVVVKVMLHSPVHLLMKKSHLQVALITQLILCLRADSVHIMFLIAKAVHGTRLFNGIHLVVSS